MIILPSNKIEFMRFHQDSVKHQTRFVSEKPAKVVLSTMEVIAQSMGYKTHIRNYKVKALTILLNFGFKRLSAFAGNQIYFFMPDEDRSSFSK